MNRHRMGLFLLTAVALTGFAGQSEAQYVTDARIIHKAALSPERLADALAAKALLTNMDPKLLRSAAELVPRDPRYWYLSAVTRWWYLLAVTRPIPPNDESTCRPQLERALTVDPSFLPALYAYVVSKPTHDQRMQGLERLAALDKDNAKPYYLMAIESYQETTRGRSIIRSSGLQPYQMSRQEWQAVLDLIREGNQQPSFHANLCKLPSVRDLRAYVHARRASQAEMDSRVLYNVESSSLADNMGFAPVNYFAGSYARQFARQADWEAGKLSKAGNVAEALGDLAVVKEFGAKYASAEPHRLVSFANGCSVRLIALAEQQRMSEAAGDATSVGSLQKETVRWKAASKEALRLGDIAFEPKNYPPDYAREERLVENLLAGLGLVEANPPK